MGTTWLCKTREKKMEATSSGLAFSGITPIMGSQQKNQSVRFTRRIAT